MPTLKNHQPEKKITFDRQQKKGKNFDKKFIINLLDKFSRLFKKNKQKDKILNITCNKEHKYIQLERTSPFIAILFCEKCGHMIKRSIR